jgi:hypothetical protein
MLPNSSIAWAFESIHRPHPLIDGVSESIPCSCQAFIVPDAADSLYHPASLGWSTWDCHLLDNAFRPFRGSTEIESVWLSCVE